MKQKRILGMILAFILVLVSVFGRLPYGVSAASKIKLNKSKVTIKAGNKYQLKVKNLPKKAKITWSTSNKKKATVSKKGIVKAKKIGTVTIRSKIRYKAGGKKRTVKLTCKVTISRKSQSSGKILIAYFTLADNYKNPSNVDAVSRASLNIEGKEMIGHTEYLASAIQKETGGDLFSVVVKNLYPSDYDTITDMGLEEQEKNARPKLSSHVKNMDQYDTIFVGFPIWWDTMPQAMFTFLEEYDFSGKRIIPFATHGGYGVGSSVKDIQKLCPAANVEKDIFASHRDKVSKKTKELGKWIEKLGIKKGKN